MDTKQFILSFAGEEDRQHVLDMIVTSFVRFDPLVNYLSLTVDDFTSYARPYINASIQQQLALIARDVRDNSVAGVCIAHDVITEVAHDTAQLSPRVENYIEFFQALTSPLEQNAPASPGTILCAGFLAVDSKYYGANIPSLMNEYLLTAARARGYSKVVSEFTNPSNYYSYKRMFGSILKTVTILPYNDFINSKNEQPLKGAHGETILTIMDI